MNERQEEFLGNLARALEAEGLEYLLIGGQAVGSYGYARMTKDVDFLIRETEYGKWRSFFVARGYAPFSESRNFAQFNAPGGLVEVDVMFVSAETWAKMKAEGTRRPWLGAEWSTVAPLHLIALKLHALKSRPDRETVDWTDIVQIIRNCGIDVRSEAFREMVQRHGGAEFEKRFSETDFFS